MAVHHIEASGGKTAEILMVEDNPDHEALAVRAMRRNKIEAPAFVARTGPEALSYLAAPDRALPRLVLLDLKLPGMDGVEVLRHIRANERTQSIPVVVLTSSDEERDLREAYEHGANSYVLKPMEYERFVEVIRQLAGYWLSINATPEGR